MPRASKATTASTARSRQSKPAEAEVKVDEAVSAVKEQAAEEKVQAPKKTYKVRDELPPNAVITVRNGFAGKLIYKSRKTGELFEWESFGDEQDMELQELKNARNSSKGFFEKNWFLIDDPAVIEYLGVGQYYKDALTYDNFDELFELSADAIGERIAKLSKGQRSSVVYRAKQLIKEEKIDSIKIINALEESLGVMLIER